MGKYFTVLFWSASTVALSIMLKSVMESFSASLFLATMLLPGIIFVKYHSGAAVSFKDKKSIAGFIYLISIFMLIEELSIITVYWTVYRFELPDDGGIVPNPVFLCIILIALLSAEKLFRTACAAPESEDRYVVFTSNRKKVSLKTESITFIESNDCEVFVHTDSGKSYPTRMKISQWEAALGDGFLRVHRSFLVNIRHISSFDSKEINVGSSRLEISRKYKAAVTERLGGRKPA